MVVSHDMVVSLDNIEIWMIILLLNTECCYSGVMRTTSVIDQVRLIPYRAVDNKLMLFTFLASHLWQPVGPYGWLKCENICSVWGSPSASYCHFKICAFVQ